MKFENTVFAFIKDLDRFDYRLFSIDHVWEPIFPDRNGRWRHVHVTRYHEKYFINHIDGNTCGLEVVPRKSVTVMQSFGSSLDDDGRYDPARVWTPIIESARAWLTTVANDWIRANRRVYKEYPLNRRFGIAANFLVRASLGDMWRIDLELGLTQCRKFIRCVESGYFAKEENTTVESMTAGRYFEYCRIAYIAARRKDDRVDERLTGKEMYERYADGRHEGLLDIDENSAQEFADWIDGKHPKKSTGGHPWEIKRGGNTTHIDLSVFRPYSFRQDRFKIELRGAAINRLAETVRMFLAIRDASLPISIDDPEGIRMRLLAQDTIGIIPGYDTLHRANQHFDRERHVYDVLHYDDLGRYKRRITPFITWEPLPVLKPKRAVR